MFNGYDVHVSIEPPIQEPSLVSKVANIKKFHCVEMNQLS